VSQLRGGFDPRRPTALFLGRFQPFHAGHRLLIEEGLRDVGQACIAVRDAPAADEASTLTFLEVKQQVEAGLSDHAGRFIIVPAPNITRVFLGRAAGDDVERIDLDTAVDAELALPGAAM
jgi:cytidyltransferase-like protein